MSIKINRALRKSGFAAYHETAAAIVAAVPDDIVVALSSTQLATLYQAMHGHWCRAVAHAERAVCSEGWAWDDRRRAGRDLAS